METAAKIIHHLRRYINRRIVGSCIVALKVKKIHCSYWSIHKIRYKFAKS